MSLEGRFVECDEHGKQQETFVCQHIVQTLEDRKPRGFWWAQDTDNPRPDAWCTECDRKVQLTEGEWTDESESFAGIKLICGGCYEIAKNISINPSKLWWQLLEINPRAWISSCLTRPEPTPN